MKVYYAHCIAIYNTPQEDRDVALLESLGFEVINPNTKECDEGYKEKGMLYFKEILKEAHALCFRSLPSGEIPAGVHKEIMWMKKRGCPIFELPTGIVGREASVERTREYLIEMGIR